MKFQPTIELWAGDTLQQLRDGRLRLQRGQWVTTGGGKRGRYYGTSTGGVIYVAHYPKHVRQFAHWVAGNAVAEMR